MRGDRGKLQYTKALIVPKEWDKISHITKPNRKYFRQYQFGENS
jgi:hypothetical protein